MEYVDGRPLSKMIASENLKSNEKLITRIFSQIIDALNYVHKKQIIHRDLKPDNILVTYRGDNVKILGGVWSNMRFGIDDTYGVYICFVF